MADRSFVPNTSSIAAEPFGAVDAAALRADLARELGERYAGDAEPGDKPTSAEMTVFLVARDGQGAALGCGGMRDLGEGVAESRCFERSLEEGR